EVVNQIQFQTGGWDAEYGNKLAAVINVQTRVPTGGFHGEVSTYLGQYSNTVQGPRSFDGQSFSTSGNDGKLGIFFSGARQFSDMRLEPVVADPAGRRVFNFHNDGNDYYGFLKLQYAAGTQDNVSLDLNASQTRFAVPYDSTGGAFTNDRQTDGNDFVNLSWRHQFAPASASGSTRTPADLFAALFYRHGALDYTPGEGDQAQFVFAPDTSLYTLTERRQFNTYGLRLDYAIHPRAGVEFKVGTISSLTRGHEDFLATAQNGAAGPASNSALSGSDVGVYAQTAITPVSWFELRTGVRYDAHTAPFAGTQRQASPRVRLNFYPSSATTLYAYYGRLFIPTNVEDLRAITSAALGSSVSPLPTLPERDNFYEAGLIERVPTLASTLKVSVYHKTSSPGIDDNTVPGSAITTSVNIQQVRITGIEAVAEYRPNSPVSAYLNAALNHAYGEGTITGGFFPVVPPSGTYDLDHDQRLSLVGSLTYAPGRFFVSGTAIYGSGLTNGLSPSDTAYHGGYGTGLFDFNRAGKVKPSAIFNPSAGYTFIVNGRVVRPQVYVENAFNHQYLLKGAFFSGASVGRPRSIQARINFGL
ncbi:MAG TPA: TonB-dependent receptor, partial [Gemmatirosa sp.]